MSHQLSLLIISSDLLPATRRYRVVVNTNKNHHITSYKKYIVGGPSISWNSYLRLNLTSSRNDTIEFRLKGESWLCAKTVGTARLSVNDLFYNQEKNITLNLICRRSGAITGSLSIQLKALNFGWVSSRFTSGFIYIEPLGQSQKSSDNARHYRRFST